MAGSVRIVGGSFPWAGRVEICIDDHYGTVCDDGWGNDDARVVCRQLGYDDGEGKKKSCPSLLFVVYC